MLAAVTPSTASDPKIADVTGALGAERNRVLRSLFWSMPVYRRGEMPQAAPRL